MPERDAVIAGISGRCKGQAAQHVSLRTQEVPGMILLPLHEFPL